MSLINRRGGEAFIQSFPSSHLDHEAKYGYDEQDQPALIPVDDMTDPTTRLHRELKTRQVTMIVIGGAIGTGIILGTGVGLYIGGPLSILISYITVGLIVYLVMCALGEMATWLPLESGFTGYAARFCDPALGFALGYIHLFKCEALSLILILSLASCMISPTAYSVQNTQMCHCHSAWDDQIRNLHTVLGGPQEGESGGVYSGFRRHDYRHQLSQNPGFWRGGVSLELD